MSNHSHDSHQHITPYSTYIIVLAILLALTAVTVAVILVDLGVLSVAVALIVATIKAAIVLLYFMHLKYDDKFFMTLVAIVFAVYTVVMVITFFDYLFR
ncbi:MAG: cytochrome C oxidase subunit IV family protein [Bacteroidetes bacterium]|nr:cytochrome C oxidase subunit IV family protein [Bacteroidota bacterium]